MISILNKIPYLFGIMGVIMIILGFINEQTPLEGNYFLWGVCTLLFSLHLFNSQEITKLEEEMKNEDK